MADVNEIPPFPNPGVRLIKEDEHVAVWEGRNAMKWLNGAVQVVLVLAILAPFALTAGAQQPGDWQGVTSQSLPMQFTIVSLPTGPVIRSWGFNFQLKCPRQTRFK